MYKSDKKKEEEVKESVPQLPYNKDADVEQRAMDLWLRFLTYKENRNQSIRFFSKDGIDRNLLDYVSDSVDRMNEYHPKAEYKEDWQANTFDPITRNKIIFILGMMASSRMKPDLVMRPSSIFSTDDINERKRVYADALEHANYHNKDEQRLIWEMYTCLSQGTVIGFEDFKKGEVEIEEVIEFDPDTGEKKTRKIVYDMWDDVYGRIIPIDEWYPETIWTSNLDDIHRCIWVRKLTMDQFKDIFCRFKNYSEVQVASFYTDQENFSWGVSEDVRGDYIEVMYYFDDIKNIMQINANMVELYNGPMPWNHRRIPFWIAQAEPISDQFLYGKSLPDKLMSMQDVNNGMLNGMLDQFFMGINSPIFIDGSSNLDDGYLEPNKVVELDPGTKIQKLSLGQIDQTAFQLLNLLKRSMEESSSSAQAQGVPTGGRKTKYEVQQLQEGAMQIASLFLQLFEGGYATKYWLRLQNKLQYMTMPSRKKSGKKEYKYIELDNRPLSNGKMGKRMLQVLGPGEQPPAKEELKEMLGKRFGAIGKPDEMKVQPVFLSKDYFKNREIDLEVRIVPNSSVKESEFQRKNRAIQYYQLTANNPLIDQRKNTAQLTEAFDQPEDLLKEEEPMDIAGMGMGMGQPEQAQPQIDVNEDIYNA